MTSKLLSKLSRTLALVAVLGVAAMAGCGGGGDSTQTGTPGGAVAVSSLAGTAFKDLQDAYQFAAVTVPDLPVSGWRSEVAVGLAKWHADDQRISRSDYVLDGQAWRAAARSPIYLLGASGWRPSTSFPTDGRWTVLPDGTLEISDPLWDGLSARIERIDSFLVTRQGYPSPGWTIEQSDTPPLVEVSMPQRVATRTLRWRFPTDVHSFDPDHGLEGIQATSFDDLRDAFRGGRACQVRIQGDEPMFGAWIYVAADGSVYVSDTGAFVFPNSGRAPLTTPQPGTLGNWQPTPSCDVIAALPRPVAVSRRVVAGQEIVVLDDVPQNVLKSLGCYEIGPVDSLDMRGRPMCRMILASFGARLRPGLLRPKDIGFVEATQHAPWWEYVRGFGAFDRAGIDAHTTQLSLPPAP